MSFLRCGQKRINGFFSFFLYFFYLFWICPRRCLSLTNLGYLVSDILGMALQAKKRLQLSNNVSRTGCHHHGKLGFGKKKQWQSSLRKTKACAINKLSIKAMIKADSRTARPNIRHKPHVSSSHGNIRTQIRMRLKLNGRLPLGSTLARAPGRGE